MKIVSYNIRFGLGTDHRIDLKRIAETVCDADIIGLQEVERFWKRGGMTPKRCATLTSSAYRRSSGFGNRAACLTSRTLSAVI